MALHLAFSRTFSSVFNDKSAIFFLFSLSNFNFCMFFLSNEKKQRPNWEMRTRVYFVCFLVCNLLPQGPSAQGCQDCKRFHLVLDLFELFGRPADSNESCHQEHLSRVSPIFFRPFFEGHGKICVISGSLDHCSGLWFLWQLLMGTRFSHFKNGLAFLAFPA